MDGGTEQLSAVITPLRFTRLLAASLLSLIAAVSVAIAAEGPTRFLAARPSRVLLAGSSNLAEWRCSGKTIAAEVEIDATAEKINEVIDRVEDGNIAAWMATPEKARFPQPRFHLSIPIGTLRCGNRIMERDLVHALKADRYPAIEFRFLRLAGAIERDIDRNLYEARVLGKISAAGVTRPMVLPVVAQRINRNRFRLRAELPLRMTDFDITPPTALFGMIKAANELKVRFDLILQPVADTSTPDSKGVLRAEDESVKRSGS